MVEFRLLGPVEVLAEGRPLSPGGRRERGLLVLLLLSLNRVVPSERLADELWPDSSRKEALHSLRVAVSGLRKAFSEVGTDDLLVTRSPGYLLRAEPETLDVTRFETLVRRARAEMASQDHRRAGETLRAALSLWRGPALADVMAPFAAAEIARLEEVRLTALEMRVEADLATGRHTELPAELEALTDAHPLREALWGYRMLALYRSGRQAEALRCYQDIRRILVGQLGIEPGAPLADLERAILRHDPGLGRTPRPPAPAGTAAGLDGRKERTPFIGREHERAELRRLLARAADGRGSLVFIGGEPGVGKSRLTEELAAEARPGFRILTGHCYESGRDLPYMPWVELIEAALADSEPGELRQALGDESAEFARLVPELRRFLPDIPPPVELPAEQQRRYTFNSIREYVTRASRSQPRLYVVEDLHWADEPTLLLLEHIADRLSEIPCLIVGTHRSSPSDLTPHLTATLANLVRRRQADRLELSRHSESEVEALLGAMSEEPPPAAVRAAIYQETDGNVFFVEELFRHLAESGRLLDEEGRFRRDLAIDDLEVPANVRLVIDRRLDRLDDATCGALAIAAVAGRHLGFELWEAIADIKGDTLIDAVDGAERAGLIVTRGTGHQEEYWFGHELIRQTLLTRLPAARRRHHHLRVADALERRFAGDLAAQAGTIAAHLIAAGAAGDPARLFRYLVLAGQRSLVSAAFEDAARHLRRAADLEEHTSAAEWADMLFHLGMAERGAGNLAAAVDAWSREVELCVELGDTGAIRRHAPVAAFSLVAAGHYLEAYTLAQRGLAALGHRAADEGGPLLALSGFCLAIAGDYEAGLDSIARALDTAERLGDRVLAGQALVWKGAAHHVHMESRACVESGLLAAEVIRPTNDLWQLAVTLGLTAFSLPSLGRLADARRIALEARPLAERIGAHVTRMHCGRARAMADWCETGDLDELEAFSRRDMQLCLEAGLPWVSWSWSWLGLATFLRGDWEQAVLHAAKAAELAPPGAINGAEWALQLEYVAHAGRRDEATAMMAARRADLPHIGRPNGWGSWAILFGSLEALVVLGELKPAAELYPLVRWCADRSGSVILMQPDARLLERAAGMAAAADSNWAVAEAHFTTALRQAEALPHRPEQAHTRRTYADMLLRRNRTGDREKACLLLGQAEMLYRAMAMPKHMAMAQALAARS